MSKDRDRYGGSHRRKSGARGNVHSKSELQKLEEAFDRAAKVTLGMGEGESSEKKKG